MVETGLIGQDGLAGTRRPLDDVDARLEQSPFEDAIQSLDSGRPALRSAACLGHVGSLWQGRARLHGRTARQRDGETRALTGDALDRHRTAHGRTDVSDDPETNAEP